MNPLNWSSQLRTKGPWHMLSKEWTKVCWVLKRFAVNTIIDSEASIFPICPSDYYSRNFMLFLMNFSCLLHIQFQELETWSRERNTIALCTILENLPFIFYLILSIYNLLGYQKVDIKDLWLPPSRTQNINCDPPKFFSCRKLLVLVLNNNFLYLGFFYNFIPFTVNFYST